MKGQEVVGVTEAEYGPHGTITVLRCALSAVVKSLSKKFMLQKYLLYSILAESSAKYSNFSFLKQPCKSRTNCFKTSVGFVLFTDVCLAAGEETTT
jgi:hypothetical protein